MIHYGSILEKAVRSSNISITELAKRLHVNRRSVYYWFEKRRLEPEVLEEIGAIINYDFKGYLPPSFTKKISTPFHQVPVQPAEDIDFWKNKYQRLLERYNSTVHELAEAVY